MIEIFVKVRFLYKQLKAAMIAGRNPFDTIAIIIIFKSVYSNFKAITANIFKTGNKTIEEIKSIIQLKEAKHKVKQLTGQLKDAAIATVIAFYGDNGNYQKRKANNNDKYYNCY